MRNPQGNDVSRPRARIVLALMIGLAVLAMVMGWAMSPARAGEVDKCMPIAEFVASIKGAAAKPIPAASYAKARSILDNVSPTKQGPSDAASLLTFPDGSAALLYANNGCLRMVLPVPRNIQMNKLQSFLFSERLSSPTPPEGAILPDPYDRLSI